MLRPIAGFAVLLLGCGLLGASLSGAEEKTPLYGAHGVSPQAVLQVSLGSCSFHASIAALAKNT